MDQSLSNFELGDDNGHQVGNDSEHSSDKSDNLEIINYADLSNRNDNGNGSQAIGHGAAGAAASASAQEEDADNAALLENFDKNLPETVSLVIHQPTKVKVYIIGTAHFSNESKEDVIKVIRNVLPNATMLELCHARTNILSLDEKTILEEAKNIDLQKVISHVKNSGVYQGLMYILLLNMSAKLTKQLGMAPGGEFRTAYQESKKIKDCPVILGDRPLQITLSRALSQLTWWQTIKLSWLLITSKDAVTVEDIEKCKKKDMLEQLLEELAGEYPAFREVFLDERDIFLTNSLQQLCYRTTTEHRKAGSMDPIKVVGVVGIGHVPGILRLWPYDQNPYVNEIMTIPPPSRTSKIVKGTIKILTWTFAGYLVFRLTPIPKTLKDNAQLAFQSIIANLKQSGTGSGFKYTLH